MALSASERHWRAVQRAVDARLAATGCAHLSPLGEEYVCALESAKRLREHADEKPYSELTSGRIVANPLYEASDRDGRRAIQLAKALGLDKPAPAGEQDPFANLDAERVPANLAAQRAKRARK